MTDDEKKAVDELTAYAEGKRAHAMDPIHAEPLVAMIHRYHLALFELSVHSYGYDEAANRKAQAIASAALHPRKT